MFKRLLVIFTLVLLGLAHSVFVRSHELYSHPAGPHGEIHTHELGVAITCASPPYYYLNGDNGGREWNLMAAAFDDIRHSARSLYLPMTDALKAFQEGWLDAVWVCGGIPSEVRPSWYWSRPLIPRRFAAISLADNETSIQSIDDLSGKRLGIHPDDYAALSDTAVPLAKIEPPIQSISNHTLLLVKLFTHQIDILVAETDTFEYFRNKLPAKVEPERTVVMQYIFPVLTPRLLFRDAILRDEFNMAWTALCKNLHARPDINPLPCETGLERAQ
jgi:hypothetical protein